MAAAVPGHARVALVTSAVGGRLAPPTASGRSTSAVDHPPRYASVFAALVGLEAFLRRRHGPAVALLATLGIFLATPLPLLHDRQPVRCRTACRPRRGHAFVLAWLWAREADDRRRWLLPGRWAASSASCAPQDAVLLALPLLDLLRRGARRALRPWLPAFLAGPARPACCSWPSG